MRSFSVFSKCWEEERGGRKAQTKLAGDTIAWVLFSFGKDYIIYRIILYAGLYLILHIINIAGEFYEHPSCIGASQKAKIKGLGDGETVCEAVTAGSKQEVKSTEGFQVRILAKKM